MPKVLVISELSSNEPTLFEFVPSAAERSAIAEALGLLGLRKLRFSGEVFPVGAADWGLRADLGATVVQPCVVTLDPVTTRIDEKVERTFLKEMPDISGAAEIEMPVDDTVDLLDDSFDLEAIASEALSLALPAYPRKDDAPDSGLVAGPPGTAPMTDEDAKPFAALAGLKAQLSGQSDTEGD